MARPPMFPWRDRLCASPLGALRAGGACDGRRAVPQHQGWGCGHGLGCRAGGHHRRLQPRLLVLDPLLRRPQLPGLPLSKPAIRCPFAPDMQDCHLLYRAHLPGTVARGVRLRWRRPHQCENCVILRLGGCCCCRWCITCSQTSATPTTPPSGPLS